MENKNSVRNGRLVDVFIVDKRLIDRILKKCPGLERKFNEDNFHIQQTVYGFLRLNEKEYEAVKPVLHENRKKFEYEVRDSETGRFIELNSFNIGYYNNGTRIFSYEEN